MLELKDVALAPDAPVFDQSFAVGEISVVLGANLAGKTDLCRLIAGLPTRAQAREIRLDGIDLTNMPTRERPVALVYQAFVNYPNWTVARNIASPLVAQKLTQKDIDVRVGELSEALGLTELLDRLPSELSGGQQQRVALARALAKDARVLLLDQPLVNLDYKLREAMQSELKTLLHRRDTVVVYTTNEIRETFALGDQVLLLAGGERLQTGAPIDVYRNPASVPAMDLMSEPRANRVGGRQAFRPEHGSLTPVPESAVFPVEIVATETNGGESYVHVRSEDDDWVIHAAGIVALESGSAGEVHVRREDLFDA